MYRVAICDNDRNDLNKTEEMFKKHINKFNQQMEIICFQNPEILKERIEENDQFDVYVLDIIMPNINGIELGKIIRNHKIDSPIIYTTSSREYAFESYEVKAYQYLEKPLKQEKVDDVMRDVWELLKARKNRIVYIKCTEGIITVNQDDIMYIENYSRKITYTIWDGRTLSSTRNAGSFEDTVLSIVDGNDFVQPHKSYFINMKYIKVFNAKEICMDDGRKIPVNQKRLPAIKKKIINFLTKES